MTLLRQVPEMTGFRGLVYIRIADIIFQCKRVASGPPGRAGGRSRRLA